jgi:hypothetical protein
MADSWIGGDLGGLRTMATTMEAAPEQMRGVERALSGGVDALVGAAGWSGAAADSFRRAWTADAMAAGTLSGAIAGVAATLTRLVGALEILDRAQHEAAEAVHKAGVPVSEVDGSVAPFIVAAPADGSVSPAVAASATYAREVTALRAEARQARAEAEKDLLGFLDQLLSGAPKATPDLYVTTADYLRGLLAMPNEADRNLVKTYKDRMDELQQARIGAKADVEAARTAGASIKPGDPAYAPYRRAIDAIKDLDHDTAGARAGLRETSLSKMLNFKIGDIAAVEAAKLPKFLEFTKEIPVLDIAATGAAAALQTKDDMEKGWSLPHAAAVDVGAGAIGLGTGLGVAATVSGPVGWVAAGAGIAAVGVGDFAYQAFHEHWSEDIHEHGVVGGVLTGIEHSGAKVGDDLKNVVTDVGHGAMDLGKSLWHGLFD